MKSDRLPASFEYLAPATPEAKIPGAFQHEPIDFFLFFSQVAFDLCVFDGKET